MAFSAPSFFSSVATIIAFFITASPAHAQRSDEVVVKIMRVKAVDKADIFSKADFYAKVTIAGEAMTTKPIRGSNDVRPDWVLSKKVPRGTHDIKIELLDKDPLKPDDKIDINRVGSKRDLEFKINTTSCRVLGFSDDYRCASRIVRVGGEKKSAEIRFSVSVKK